MKAIFSPGPSPDPTIENISYESQIKEEEMKAIFSPGPSYHDPEVRKYAGWVRILDLYREGLEELGYEVFIPKVDPSLIDQSSTVSKILSYDVVAASQIPTDVDLFLGPPGYSLAQIMMLKDRHWPTLPYSEDDGVTMKIHIPTPPKIFTYVWNNQDWWRDQQLAEEYKRFGRPYDLSLTWRWINETALKLCDHVIACSPWVKKTHAKIVPENKISISFWGVDSQMFTPAEVEPPGFRVLFVGGDPIRKGLGYLIDALFGMNPLATQLLPELWIAGCEVELRDIGFPVKQFGMVPFAQMPEIYRQCHVLCIPTLEDGIALAIQEGMASGLVPITSPETAEVFEDGKSGIKVGYRDVDGIRNALVMLKENPEKRREMAREARVLAEQQTWAETKRQFKEIIKEVDE